MQLWKRLVFLVGERCTGHPPYQGVQSVQGREVEPLPAQNSDRLHSRGRGRTYRAGRVTPWKTGQGNLNSNWSC
ncbi:MAG: hypothetical protein ACRDFB_01525 [Rhabdochlamydiaceae bacterium]